MKQELRVLIMDDDQDLCHLLKQILGRKTGLIFKAHTVHDGLDCVKTVKPDIIFLDNNFPDGNGIDHISTIKKLQPQAKIIMISGDTVEGLKEKAEELGADKFYAKPFSYDIIQKAVASLNLAWLLPAWYILSNSIDLAVI